MRRTLILIPVLALAAAAQPKPELPFDEALAKAAAFQTGDDERPLYSLDRIVLPATSSPAKKKEMEEAFLKALPGATVQGKDRIVRYLSVVGTADSVPPLAALLNSEETADIGRYGLERIPGPEVNQTMREMLPKTSGRVRVGIVNTLGNRRDPAAVPALARLIASGDAQTSSAAAAALGKIADPAATSALGSARAKTSGAVKTEVERAWLRCAEQENQRGGRVAAFAVFKQLAQSDEPQVRIAALGGIAKSGGAEAVPLLSAAVRDKDPAVQAQAIRQLSHVPGAEALRALGSAEPSLSSLGKVRALSALADRGDKAALPWMLEAAKDPDVSVRVAAFLGLGKLGGEHVVMLLAETAAQSGQPIAEAAPRTGGFPMGGHSEITAGSAARESLYGLRGTEVDSAILNGLNSAEPAVKAELIAAVAERDIRAANPALLKSVADPNASVRRASLRALRSTARPEDTPVLLDLLTKAQSSDRTEMARVLSSALKRSDSSSIAPVMAAYNGTPDNALRGALLAVLAQVGRDESLPVLRGALKDSDTEIRRGAILALAEWPTSSPMQDLADTAANDASPALQILSVQGYIRLIGSQEGRPPAETVRLLGQAMKLAKRPEEKRAALAILQRLNTTDALALAEEAAKDPDVAAEAKTAAERIRTRLTR